MSGVDLAGDSSDLFGVWRPGPGESDGMRSFSTEDTPMPVWSAWLPAAPWEASVHMSAAEATLAQVHARLPVAEGRLADVLTQGGLTQQDADLLAGIAALQATSSVSFGLSDVKSTWSDASARALAAVKQVQAGISTPGIIETHVGEALIGRTSAGVIGAERTILRADCTPAQMELHQRTVNLALSSRVAMVSMLAVAVRSAARLAVTLAVPGGPLLLVPSVLRFIASAAHDPA